MIRRIIQGSQINKRHNLQWIPYDEFKEIKHIANGDVDLCTLPN